MIQDIPPAMMKPFLIIGNWIAGALLLSGSYVIAQASAENVERYLGGVTILGVGVFVVRWVVKTSQRVEDTWSKALDKAEERAEAADARCEALRVKLDETNMKYDRERQLRISLEESGLHDRRHRPDADPESV